MEAEPLYFNAHSTWWDWLYNLELFKLELGGI